MSRLVKQRDIIIGVVFFAMSVMSVAFAQTADDQLQLTPINQQSSQSAQQETTTPAATADASATTTVPKTYTEDQLFPQPTPDEQTAFTTVARSALPMTPDEIRRLKAMVDMSQRASAAPVEAPPKPVLSTQLVNLDPGSAPPVVRLEEGFVSSIVFTDQNGTAWPIESYDLGNSKAFNIEWQPESNMLMVQAMNPYTFGNIAVKLKGLTTPVMMTLVPGQKVVDYRADLQIQQLLPGSPTDGVSTIKGTAVNITLLDVLNGVPPDDAKVLNVTGGDAEAWLIKDKLYVRTNLTILSPSWDAVMKNGDGTSAYMMEKTPTILVSHYGTPIQLNIEGLSS